MSSADYLTKEQLQPGLQRVFQDETLIVKDITFNKSDLAGDHYVAGVDLAVIDVVSENSKTDNTVEVFIKRHAKSEKLHEMMEKYGVFEKESDFYSKLIPEMQRFIANTPITLDHIISKCYYTTYSPTEGAIVLENLVHQGYQMRKFDIYNLQDLNHVKVVMEAIALFHAVTFAMKKQFNIRERFPCLKEVLFTDDPNGIFLSFFKNIMHISSEVFEESDKIRRDLNKLLDRGFQKVLEQVLAPCEPLTVINHADLWNNNMMFKYNPNGEPMEVKLVDWQGIRYASMNVDLCNFLYTSTSLPFRQKHTKEVLQIYYDKFVNTVQYFDNISWETDGFTFELMYKDYHSRELQGFIITPILQIMNMMTKDEKKDPDEATDIFFDLLTSAAKKMVKDPKPKDIIKKSMTENYYALEDLFKQL